MAFMKKGELFNSIEVKSPDTNTFDLSHQTSGSAKFGWLYPTMIMEAIPGDRFQIKPSAIVRTVPLMAPAYARMEMKTTYFFVPIRIIYEDWEKFITGSENTALNMSHPTLPYATVGNLKTIASFSPQNKELMHYIGIPNVNNIDSAQDDIRISLLPFQAYQRIFWDYYQHQELSDDSNYNPMLHSGEYPFDVELQWITSLEQTGWRRDYFTSALPFAQKGPAVEIPVGNVEIGLDPDFPGTKFPFFTDGTGTTGSEPMDIVQTSATSRLDMYLRTSGTIEHSNVAYDPNDTLVGVGTATTINDLRTAYRLQEWLEKNARAGTRYIESIKAHFDVDSSDKRLQRAEYICSISTPIVIGEVVNTAGGTLPQGNLAGMAVGYIGETNEETYYCEEHGYLIGVTSFNLIPNYSQSVPRYLTNRFDPMDWPFPEFANLGEQPIYNLEVNYKHLTPDGIFGYIPRYSEFKFMNDKVYGLLNNEYSGTTTPWAFQREFLSNVALNYTFIFGDIQTVSEQIFAVEDTDPLIWSINHDIKVTRKLPVFGTPMT